MALVEETEVVEGHSAMHEEVVDLDFDRDVVALVEQMGVVDPEFDLKHGGEVVDHLAMHER